jgi:hypothetical protein
VIQWDFVAQASTCGVIGIVLVLGLRLKRKTKPTMTLFTALGLFFSCAMVPSVFLFARYPFIKPRPSLEDNAILMIPAALAMAWAIGEGIRQALK